MEKCQEQMELLKHEEDELDKRLAKLCNNIWSTGTVPQDWQNGIIIPLPKTSCHTD